MSSKSRYKVVFSKKLFLISLIIFTFLIPILPEGSAPNSHIDYIIYNSNEDILRASEITKDNYSAILKGSNYGYGNITVDDLHFDFLELGFFNHNIYYPLIINEYEINALNMTLESINFIETSIPAVKDNLDPQIIRRERVTVKINETLEVRYNNPNEGYLIYHSSYSQTELLELHVDNGTVISNLTAGVDFYIDNVGFIVFYYKNFFSAGPIFNFTMYLIWNLDLPITDWLIDQRIKERFIMREIEEDLEAKFTYQFRLVGHRYGLSLEETTPIPYLDVALTINLADKEELENHELILNGIKVIINPYLNPDNSIGIKLSDNFRPNSSFFSLNFTAPFRIKFEDPVGDTWAIDRLVKGRNVRERTYIASVLSGPEHLYLKGISFIEPGIFFEDVIGNYSLFNRNVAYFPSNASDSDQFNLQIIIPLILPGEVCPFSIKYVATQQLRIVVTDNIKMPLVGATLEILHFGAIYGTYISNNTVQPLDPGKTDENGEVFLSDIPNGNYTIRVFYQGSFIKEALANTNNEIIRIYTNYPHFPLWILVFGLVNVIILIFGLLFYLKNKRSR